MTHFFKMFLNFFSKKTLKHLSSLKGSKVQIASRQDLRSDKKKGTTFVFIKQINVVPFFALVNNKNYTATRVRSFSHTSRIAAAAGPSS